MKIGFADIELAHIIVKFAYTVVELACTNLQMCIFLSNITLCKKQRTMELILYYYRTQNSF